MLRVDRDGVLYEDDEWSGPVDWSALEEAEAEAAELRWRQSNGRAASRSRRYFVKNRLRYMWVLTFAASVVGREVVMGLVSEFARRLRGVLGGRAFPYWYSPELHPGGHGWHVNFFIAQRLDHAVVTAVWGLGHVWVTDFATSPRAPKGEALGLCRTREEGSRRAARYGCKYAQKDWSPEHIGPNSHRYEVAQGFAPVAEKSWVSGRSEAETMIARIVPEDRWERVEVWDSDQEADWNRPPVRTWRW